MNKKQPGGLARLLTCVGEALYNYHYQLGVYVVRRGRHLIRFLARITRGPRRRMRYAWLVRRGTLAE